MKSRLNSIISPPKISQSSSFILPVNEHIGAFNKTTEKIRMLQLDLETSKDTIIKLRSEIVQKNQEIKNLKFNNNDKYNEFLYVLKVIEIALKLIDPNIFNININNKTIPFKENDLKTDTYNTINNNFNSKVEDNGKDTLKEENEKNLTVNLNNENKKRLKRNKTFKSEQIRKKLDLSNNLVNKNFPYLNSLQNKITLLKELILKKEDEMKEIEKTRSAYNYFNLKDNLEQNFSQFEKIKKQNEIMRTKIEDVSNLLFLEREGNKSLKNKLHVFQSSFKEFQESSEKKNIDLETKLFKAQEKQRDCRIFHVRKADMFENKYKIGTSLSKLNNTSLDDNERLKIADKEIENIKKEIEEANKDIENKKNQKNNLKENNESLKKKVQELTETNNKIEQEFSKLQKNFNKLTNTKNNLKKENKDNRSNLHKAKIKLNNEQEKTENMKETLKKKEQQILDMKKELEKLKQNNNFKDGTFFTSIGAKGKRKNDDLQNLDVNIDEELAEIEKKYNMLNQKEKEKENKEEDDKEKKQESNNDSIKTLNEKLIYNEEELKNRQIKDVEDGNNNNKEEKKENSEKNNEKKDEIKEDFDNFENPEDLIKLNWGDK